MATVHRKVDTPYTPAEMFHLVDNIEEYCLFLPWCKESKVLSRTPDEVHATLMLAASGMQKSFTTHNRLQTNKMIEISLVNGPFKHLDGFWQFHLNEKNSCTIQFNLEFEFSSKLLSLAFAPVFQQVSSTLVDAFTQRAVQVYGKR